MQQQKELIHGAIAIFISLAMYFCFIYRNFKIIEDTQNKFSLKIQPTLSWAISIFFVV
jgi:cell division protein FtsW (lipid II flippase)